MRLRILDLFSGIGGISLGLERSGGFETKMFCEKDRHCQTVLAKHWPKVRIHGDVRTLSVGRGEFDVVCGGFPCQDISVSGKGAGLKGERSGLWWEMHRIVRQAGPQWVIAENVPALRSRGLDEVLRSLNEIGYDAEWHCIPARAVGAPHRRDRIWIVAYPHSDSGTAVGWPPLIQWDLLAETERFQASNRPPVMRSWEGQGRWPTEPSVGRVVDGLPGRMDRRRVKALGNSVVPQIPEAIGKAIMEASN